METKTLSVDAARIGSLTARPVPGDLLDELAIQLDAESEDARHLETAAAQLRNSNVPVAFPTETVYGLGADATRSESVRGIYKAKQRPSDNPLIVHFASLRQLRTLLATSDSTQQHVDRDSGASDPIPVIYQPLISRFWPGPLTILLPNPKNSRLAPEVTAGLDTFGARMPAHALALALIQLADVPVAAPSANASTKPSPTTAEHVAYDLQGRIETILDGGPCSVGVESTVVDGLSSPPLVLRPGGISLEQLRSCPGWEDTQIGYKNTAETDNKPKAPGMKYRHYSPKATVILFESNNGAPSTQEICQHAGPNGRIGLIRTRTWRVDTVSSSPSITRVKSPQFVQQRTNGAASPRPTSGFGGMLQTLQTTAAAKFHIDRYNLLTHGHSIQLLDISLGPENADVARGIFSALRDLDREGADTIFVEGIDENEGQAAAAVMNRLRKAAEIRVKD